VEEESGQDVLLTRFAVGLDSGDLNGKIGLSSSSEQASAQLKEKKASQ
jgi:hypothetical protein